MTGKEWLNCRHPTALLELFDKNKRWKEVISAKEWRLARKPSERTLRLFAVACGRRIWSRISDEEVRRGYTFLISNGAERMCSAITPDCGRRALEVAEQHADGLCDGDPLAAIRLAVQELRFVGEFYASTKPTVIGRDLTDYAYLALGEAALAAEIATQHACSLEEAIYAAEHSARVVAFLNCRPEDPLPTPQADIIEQRHQSDLVRDIFGNPFRPVAFDAAWNTSTVVALARGMYAERDFSAMPILADALQDAGCDNDDILQHCRGAGPHVRGCWVVDGILGKS